MNARKTVSSQAVKVAETPVGVRLKCVRRAVENRRRGHETVTEPENGWFNR